MKNGGSNMNIKTNSRYSIEDSNIKLECSGNFNKVCVGNTTNFWVVPSFDNVVGFHENSLNT